MLWKRDTSKICFGSYSWIIYSSLKLDWDSFSAVGCQGCQCLIKAAIFGLLYQTFKGNLCKYCALSSLYAKTCLCDNGNFVKRFIFSLLKSSTSKRCNKHVNLLLTSYNMCKGKVQVWSLEHGVLLKIAEQDLACLSLLSISQSG